jgi:hypothetical protein
MSAVINRSKKTLRSSAVFSSGYVHVVWPLYDPLKGGDYPLSGRFRKGSRDLSLSQTHLFHTCAVSCLHFSDPGRRYACGQFDQKCHLLHFFNFSALKIVWVMDGTPALIRDYHRQCREISATAMFQEEEIRLSREQFLERVDFMQEQRCLTSLRSGYCLRMTNSNVRDMA